MGDWVLLGRGRTADIYDRRDGTAVKLYRAGFSPAAARRELAAAEYGHTRGLPTPEPLGCVRIGDRRGVVFRRIGGESLLARMIADPGAAGELVRELARLHARVHDRRGTGLARKQKECMAARIAWADRLSEAAVGAIRRRLRDLPGGERLCHGDFHPGNVLLDEGGPQIIDWFDAACGHPAGDAARTVLLLQYASASHGSPAGAGDVFRRLRRDLADAYLREWTHLTGTSPAAVRRWIAPVAAARLMESLPEEEKAVLADVVRSSLPRI